MLLPLQAFFLVLDGTQQQGFDFRIQVLLE